MQKGIHDDVHFLGKQDQVHEKLAMADVMLLPSEMESFGLAALEAMACEVVPVAIAGGGLAGGDRGWQWTATWLRRVMWRQWPRSLEVLTR